PQLLLEHDHIRLYRGDVLIHLGYLIVQLPDVLLQNEPRILHCGDRTAEDGFYESFEAGPDGHEGAGGRWTINPSIYVSRRVTIGKTGKMHEAAARKTWRGLRRSGWTQILEAAKLRRCLSSQPRTIGITIQQDRLREGASSPISKALETASEKLSRCESIR